MVRAWLVVAALAAACGKHGDTPKDAPAIAVTPPAKVDAAAPTDAAGRDAAVPPVAASPPAKVLQVVMEDRVTCARRDDGKVRCWGQQDRGSYTVAVPADVAEVADVVALDLADHTLSAVTREGALWLGHVGLPKPTLLERWNGVADVIDARGHRGETYALTRTGDLHRIEAGAPIVAGNVVAVSARAGDAMDILLRDGQVELLAKGKPTKLRGLTDAETLFGTHCAHRRGGPPVCWDARGKLSPWKGAQTILDRLERSGTTCDLAGSGVACHGTNEVGQLGTGDGPDRSEPRIVDLPGKAIALAGGDRSWCAVLETGTLTCWGANDGGQLGDGTRIDRARPIVVAGAAAAKPPADNRGDEPVAGSSVAMDWSGLPPGCTRPPAIATPDGVKLTVASGYALVHARALTVWFADFALEPGGYRPGYRVTRGDQRALELELRKGSDRTRTQPIDRGRYRAAGPRHAALFAHHGDLREQADADVLIEKVDKAWICGTLLDPKDAKLRTPFAARVQPPRFRE